MSIPTSQPLPPEDFDRLTPARRRRRRRMIFPGATDQQSAFLEELAHRALPSADLFLFAIISVLILGIAIWLDAPALYFLAALFAPFMGPVLGMALASMTGTRSFFFQSLGGLILACFIYFWGGMGCGWITLIITRDVPFVPTQVFFHNQFTWPDFFVLCVGAILTVVLLVRNPSERPILSSGALAYEILLPLGVAGFGLASGTANLFPNGLLVFFTHLVVAVLICTVIMGFMGIKPRDRWSFTVTTMLIMVVSLIIIGVSLFDPLPAKYRTTQVAVTLVKPSLSITFTPTVTRVPNTATVIKSTATLVAVETSTPGSTPTNTLIPTHTKTPTASPQPTPVYAKIMAKGDSGAFVREKPDLDAPVVKAVLNDTLVEILPDTFMTNGQVWIKVRLMPDGVEGWIWRYLVITATPMQ